MGREARCACHWNGREGDVRILLEPPDVIVRGAFTARVPIDGLRAGVRGDALELTIAGDRVAFLLGESVARRWADAIATPQPSLATKLGIGSATRLHVVGASDDTELSAAIAATQTPAFTAGDEDLCLVRTDDAEILGAWARAAAVRARAPVWIVYTKGRNAPLGEAAVRDIMRRNGFVDTKVASVSERLTALRFVTETSRKGR
jgi:hypothetical protein